MPPQPPQKKNSALWVWVGVIVAVLICSGIVTGSLRNQNQPGDNSVLASTATTIPTPNTTPFPTATSQPTATPRPTSGPPQWTDVTQWTGTAEQQTEDFTVPSEWRIVWKATETVGSGIYNLEVYTSTGQFVDGVALLANNSDQETYNVHNKPGSFYLNIDTYNYSYMIEVQVLK